MNSDISTDLEGLKLWQRKLRDMLLSRDDTTIDIMYDPNRIGRTKRKMDLIKYMLEHDDAEILRCVDGFESIMKTAYDVGEKEIYFVDMPLETLRFYEGAFLHSIKRLKGGYCRRWVNGVFKERFMNKPRICIFTERLPVDELLKGSTWKLWLIQNDAMVEYPKDYLSMLSS